MKKKKAVLGIATIVFILFVVVRMLAFLAGRSLGSYSSYYDESDNYAVEDSADSYYEEVGLSSEPADSEYNGLSMSSKSTGYDADYIEAESATTEEVMNTESGSIIGTEGDNGDVSVSEESTANDTRKLITTMNITAETKQLQELVDSLSEEIEKNGGYIESSDIYMNSNKYDYDAEYSSDNNAANLVIRMPENKLNDFINGFSSIANITYKNSSVQDVSLTYVDVQSRIASLEIEKERLSQFMEQAKKLEDMLTLEERLTEVQYEIESYTSQLRNMDNRISYATLYLSLTQVSTYTEPVVEEKGFGERIAEGFMRSVSQVRYAAEEFVIAFVSNIPQLICYIIFFAILLVVGKKLYKKFEIKEKIMQLKMAEPEVKK